MRKRELIIAAIITLVLVAGDLFAFPMATGIAVATGCLIIGDWNLHDYKKDKLKNHWLC